MKRHFLMWASGQDRPGIVSSVTKVLFRLGMNLEDSSMMRLGSEFGIFLIFTSDRPVPLPVLEKSFAPTAKELRLSVGVKQISSRQAATRRQEGSAFLVSVHGPDRPGIVFHVTDCLARRRFNITDLTTHRTTSGARPGYVLFIEGSISGPSTLKTLRKDLARLQKTLKTRVDIRPLAIEQL